MPEAAKKTPRKAAAKKSAPATTPAMEASAPAKPKAKPKGAAEPSHAEISALAHRFWEERGRHHGDHTADWHRAEQHLRSGKA